MMILLSLLEAYLENHSVFILSLSLINLNEAIIIWLSLLKAYLEQYQTLILYKIYVKTSVKYRFCDICVSGFLVS